MISQIRNLVLSEIGLDEAVCSKYSADLAVPWHSTHGSYLSLALIDSPRERPERPTRRAIWYLPTGAFLLGTDYGSQVWYVDTDLHIHLLVHGDPGGAHAGDGTWFYADPTGAKVSFVKQITVDYRGNLLITESSAGYVRKIPFLPPGD